MAETLYSTMGYTPNFHPLVKKTAPLMVEKMKSEGVEAVFSFSCLTALYAVGRVCFKENSKKWDFPRFFPSATNPSLPKKSVCPVRYSFSIRLPESWAMFGDRTGQRAVCDAMVAMVQEASGPNSYRHLVYEWPEAPEKTKWKPDIPPPWAALRKQGKKKNLRDDERDGVT